MRSVLFLPMLQMPSGHHRVAEALIQGLQKRDQTIECKKVEFLSYVHEGMERLITGTYLQWIGQAPRTYETVYRMFAYPNKRVRSGDPLHKWYERLFREKMLLLIKKEKPDLIVCTHAFPSFLLGRLKEDNEIKVTIINVYTDFFLNRLWGRKGIDFHFVPDQLLKKQLIKDDGICSQNIFVTGIPVDETYRMKNRKTAPVSPYQMLFTGGNSGLGEMKSLLQKLKQSPHFECTILCGKNDQLLADLKQWRHPNFHPYGYLSSREEIGRLYDEADALVTKAGGVTISEALVKRLPIFIHSSLPGQEKMNKNYLEKQQLGFSLTPEQQLEKQIMLLLQPTEERKRWEERIGAFHDRMECSAYDKIHAILDHL